VINRLILIFAAVLALMVVTQSAFASGSIVQTDETIGNIRVVILTCTADSSAATYPTTEITAFEGRLLKITTAPGATGPTDNYDFVINNQYSTDVLGGRCADRDTADSEEVELWDNEPTGQITITTLDALSIIISNNSVNSAVVVIRLYYAMGF